MKLEMMASNKLSDASDGDAMPQELNLNSVSASTETNLGDSQSHSRSLSQSTSFLEKDKSDQEWDDVNYIERQKKIRQRRYSRLGSLWSRYRHSTPIKPYFKMHGSAPLSYQSSGEPYDTGSDSDLESVPERSRQTKNLSTIIISVKFTTTMHQLMLVILYLLSVVLLLSLYTTAAK